MICCPDSGQLFIRSFYIKSLTIQIQNEEVKTMDEKNIDAIYFNNMFSEYDDIVSIDDVMKMLHIGRTNVYKLLKKKEIKYVRFGAKYIIPKKSIIDFIIKNQIA